MIDIEAIRARCEAATEGPWVSDGGEVVAAREDMPICTVYLVTKEHSGLGGYTLLNDGTPNAIFIAHAPQDIHDLLDRNEKLEAADEEQLDAQAALCRYLEKLERVREAVLWDREVADWMDESPDSIGDDALNELILSLYAAGDAATEALAAVEEE